MATSVTAPPVEAPRPGGDPVAAAPAAASALRRSRVLLGLVAVLAVVLAVFTGPGSATFDLTPRGDEGGIGPLVVPARFTALLAALACVAVAVVQGVRPLAGRALALAAAAVGVCAMTALLCWAAAGETFPLTNQLQGTMNLATPLILGALAGVVCERAGVINIAIEGQFLIGAFTAAVTATMTGNPVAGLVAASLASVALAVLLAVFSIRYYVNQVVLGVVLNVLAAGMTGFLYDRFLQQEAASYNNPPILSKIRVPGLADIPVLGPVFFRQSVLVYLMYAIVAALTFGLFRTRWGLRLRAVGEHPTAADTVGIDVRRVRHRAVLLGGAIAGIGGAFFTVGYTGSFTKDMTGGSGFIALAALIMGRWHPVGATVAALFFGFASQLQSQLQVVETPVPTQFWLMLPYLATIVAVAGVVGKFRAPAADGEPYVKA
ncbi:MAG: ABC transporter permease [Actinomycetota bacterium]|nr:ABC transporter permease [Actinomycetota bacterium]